MIYPFVELNDGTNIVHSEAKIIDGKEQVKVYIEKPVEGGFHSAECWLPDYRWTLKQGFSDEEMKYLEDFVKSTAHLIIRLARNGGFGNASGF
ncbi:MAG: hypothetical protein SPL22_06355 [Treponema sp.]|uniref:hypothetical protein n=1 Tax=Treponema sp. TaxID=166 RepID=UPI002A90A6AB|nr:hypothetical protein [Treponema sp.]MDY6397336.1 hypothetical protein [Treponema sp.]